MTKQPKVSDEERERQTNQLYSMVGRIVVRGEQLAGALREACMFLLLRKGLDQQIAWTLFAGQNVEALRRFYTALYLQHFREDAKSAKIVGKLSDEIGGANERRNNLVHTEWFIGWGNEETESYADAAGRKFRHDLKGNGGYEIKPGKISQYADLEHTLQRLSALVRITHSAVTGEIIDRERPLWRGISLGKDGRLFSPHNPNTQPRQK